MWKSSAVRSLVLGLAMVAAPGASEAGVFISVGFAPPPLPVYVQPVRPVGDYIWTPGYWAYSDLSGYYWVPGTWVLAPQPGYLWTPPYWGFAGGVYGFHPGYWGLHVGFYGGVNYGFGYGGVGFSGGYWNHGVFAYRPVVNNVTVVNRVSYNGGPGGIAVRATAAEEAAGRERHLEATSMQAQHERAAVANHSQWASQNHGRPAFTASSRPGEFNHATPAAHAVAANRPASTPAVHANAAAHPQAHAEAHPQAHSETKPQHSAKPEGEKHEHK
jgi:WXXGXW repeat (2 copies)